LNSNLDLLARGGPPVLAAFAPLRSLRILHAHAFWIERCTSRFAIPATRFTTVSDRSMPRCQNGEVFAHLRCGVGSSHRISWAWPRREAESFLVPTNE
jgi:hypothetical protein